MIKATDPTPLGVPDYHGDAWVYEERQEGGAPWDIAAHEAQRARDGFSEYDWWHFDTFIAEIIARAALKFAREGHCYFEDMGEKGTAEYYFGIAGALMAYAQDDFDSAEEGQRRETEAKAAMMRFAEHFTRWSD